MGESGKGRQLNGRKYDTDTSKKNLKDGYAYVHMSKSFKGPYCLQGTSKVPKKKGGEEEGVGERGQPRSYNTRHTEGKIVFFIKKAFLGF